MKKSESELPRKLVALTPEMAERVDDFRFGNRIGSESEALRQLISLGLDHATIARPVPRRKPA